MTSPVGLFTGFSAWLLLIVRAALLGSVTVAKTSGSYQGRAGCGSTGSAGGAGPWRIRIRRWFRVRFPR